MKPKSLLISLALATALLAFLLCLSAGAGAHSSGETVECPKGSTPLVNGVVESAEWQDAESVTVSFEGTEATIYFKHDEKMLYFAFDIQEGHNSVFPDTRVYVDTLHDHATNPQEDDYQLYINPDNGGLQERQGDDGGWDQVDVDAWDGDWYEDSVTHWTSEYAVEFSKLDADREGEFEPLPVAFMVYGNTPGLFGVWPDNMDEEDPSSWGHMEFPDRAPPSSVTREIDMLVREGAELVPGGNDSLNFTLRNRGTEEENITLTLSGAQADWVTLNFTSATLAPEESISITLNVTAPGDAGDGFYEAIIRAEATKDDYTINATHELVILVEGAGGGGDDGDDDDSFLPGFGVSTLLLSQLAAVELLRRRRQGS